MKVYVVIGVYHGVVDRVEATLREGAVPELKTKMREYLGEDDEESDVVDYAVELS